MQNIAKWKAVIIEIRITITMTIRTRGTVLYLGAAGAF